MDAPWRRRRQRLGRRAEGARAAGLETNLELMTTAAARLAELGRPACRISTLSSSMISRSARSPDVRRDAHDGGTDVERDQARHRRRARARRLELVAAHFPEGALAAARDGSRLALGSVAMPASAIAGANGAGDAFAAGLLYGSA